jgi:phosphatidylglycerophosphate synthase
MIKSASKIDWIFYHSVLLLTAYSIDIYSHKVVATPVMGLVLFIVFIFKNFKEYSQLKPIIGYPNLVTTFRLLLLFVAPFLETNFSLFILSLIVVCSDGIDGFLARKLNQTTEFGGQLDMETDAFFCLLFSLLIYFQYPNLYWVLLAGSLRYVYKIITTLAENKNVVPSGKNFARFFAGCYFISFICFYFFEENLGKWFLAIGNLLVIFSFSWSFIDYYSFKKN